ncbi:hypothetical protein RRF57_002512 [Xylaria bambusicola]|uniref:Uncharacterized protein n=1 Tax=Xylaria bambusicola TaxID=326684 RepID=A0AAN7Z2J6_9PEZI
MVGMPAARYSGVSEIPFRPKMLELSEIGIMTVFIPSSLCRFDDGAKLSDPATTGSSFWPKTVEASELW